MNPHKQDPKNPGITSFSEVKVWWAPWLGRKKRRNDLFPKWSDWSDMKDEALAHSSSTSTTFGIQGFVFVEAKL